MKNSLALLKSSFIKPFTSCVIPVKAGIHAPGKLQRESRNGLLYGFPIKDFKNDNFAIVNWFSHRQEQAHLGVRAYSAKRVILTTLFAAFCFFSALGCSDKKVELTQAQKYTQESQNYYHQAVNEYQALIGRGTNLEELYFELGKLFFDHGDYRQAIAAFQKTPLFEAQKFLGIAYYRLGDFTEALEVFNKNKPGDDEFLYFHGLTCEKLNLFDQALEVYKKISGKDFLALAKVQIELIEKHPQSGNTSRLDAQTSKIIRDAPSQKSYPQAGALILSCDEAMEITPGNTQVSSLRYIVKILNERGKEDFSETQVEYDSTYEKVELVSARTIKPDGTVVDVGRRHIRDVSKYMNFPLYSNARVFIISFPEITEGAVIDYQVKVYRNQLVNEKDFVLEYPLQATEPIIDAKLAVKIPKDRTLRIRLLNEGYNDFSAQLAPRVKEELAVKTYLWEFKKIPQIIPETNMPPVAQITPQILASSFDSWQEVYRWWWDLAKDKIHADSVIKNKVKELTRGKRSEEDKARAIYNFCAREIRYVAVEYGQAGFEPHSAVDIFRNKYGDCKDQAVLLVTMLKEAGLEAWPVLIATKDQNDLYPDFPALPFNHCIAATQGSGSLVFLDPTAETCSFGDLPSGDQKRKVLLIKEEKFEIIDTPLYPAKHNLLRETLMIKADSDESIAARKKVFTYGVYDQGQRYSLLYTPPQLIEEGLKETIQGFSIGAELRGYKIENLDDLNTPVTLEYDFSGNEYFTTAGSLRIMPQLASLDTAMVAKDERRYPIDLGIPESQERILELAFPDDFRVKYQPDTVTEDNPWFDFSVEYLAKDNRIIFKQKQAIKNNHISQKDYFQFKAALRQLAKKVKQRIVLEKIK